MLEIHRQRVSGSWRFLFIHFPLRGVLWIQIIFKIICEPAPWFLLLFLFSVDWHCSNVKLLFKLYGVFHRPNPRMATVCAPNQLTDPASFSPGLQTQADAPTILSRASSIPSRSSVSLLFKPFWGWFSPQRQNQNALLGCKSIYKLPTWSVTPGLSSSWADVNESTSDFINRHLLMNSMLVMIYFLC